MKKLTMILLFLLSTNGFTAENKITNTKLKNSIVNMSKTLTDFSKNEWKKTKEYQEENWAKMKLQFASTKNKLSGFFSDLNLD